MNLLAFGCVLKREDSDSKKIKIFLSFSSKKMIIEE
jgi:hypothetical protein